MSFFPGDHHTFPAKSSTSNAVEGFRIPESKRAKGSGLHSFVKNCILGSESPSSSELSSVTKEFKDVPSFISFIEKTLSAAAKQGIISKVKIDQQRMKLYAEIATSGAVIDEEHLKTLPLSFQALYLSKKPSLLSGYLMRLNENDRQALLLKIAETGISREMLQSMALLKVPSLLTFDILRIASRKNQNDFLKILAELPTLSQYHPSFVFTAHQKAELLKASCIGPHNVVELVKKMGIETKEQKVSILRHHLSLYPEEMLFKIESFSDLTSDEKYQLFRETLALHPQVISSWRGAFLLKTREQLAATKCLVDMLMTFDQEKEEAAAKKKISEKFTSHCSDLLGSEPLRNFVTAVLSAEDLHYLQKKDLVVWAASLLDDMKVLSPEKKTDSFVNNLDLVSKFDPRLRYPLSGVLFNASSQGVTINKDSFALSLAQYLGFREGAVNVLQNLDKAKYEFAWSVILKIHLNSSLDHNTKKLLLSDITCSRSSAEMYRRAQAVHALLSLQDTALFEGIREGKNDSVGTFMKVMESYLGIEIMDPVSFLQSYSETFGTFRMPETMIVYAKTLQGLKDETEKSNVLGSLRELVEDVFAGKEKQRRYDLALSPHLRLLSEEHARLSEEWKKNIIHGVISNFVSGELRETLSGCSVMETDNIEEMFLCTTEVGGSCLAVNGNCEDNKGFLSYPQDGKNKLLCVKDPSGNMIGRAILRVLFDSNMKPVLLLDTFFSTLPYQEGKEKPSPYEQCSEAITKAAEKKAAALKIPLLKTFSAHDKEYKEYPLPIRSLGGRAHFECVNAVGAQGDDELCKDSKYTIKQSQILYMPISAHEERAR